MSNSLQAISPLLDHEGSGFIEEDNGRGCSKWGITLKSAQEFDPHATAENIKALTQNQASAWYEKYRWNRYRIGLIVDQAVANKVLDLVVNLGAGGWVVEHGRRTLKHGGITLLQDSLEVPIDGVIGPRTANAVNSANPVEVLKRYRIVAEGHYRELVAKHPHLEPDLKGWLSRLQQ